MLTFSKNAVEYQHEPATVEDFVHEVSQSLYSIQRNIPLGFQCSRGLYYASLIRANFKITFSVISQRAV